MRTCTSSQLRKLFLLRPDLIFLNHGALGACPRPVFKKYQSWQLELERDPWGLLVRRRKEVMRDARVILGSFIGADPDDIVFVTNATTGLNIVARSIPLAPGDEVLATDQEYGALDRTWRFICQRRGANYIRQAITLPIQSSMATCNAIWAGVTPRTRILFVSHITASTAIIIPIKELIRRAREAGIISVIDGAHAPGQIVLDLSMLGADFYVGNCHKWMMAPKGAAFLYARREMQSILDPLVVSWGWESETPSPSQFIDHHEWHGTRDIASFLSVPAAIQFMNEYNWPEVRHRCHKYLCVARQRISDLTQLEPVTPDSPDWFMQMASFPLPKCDAAELQQRLYMEFGIDIRIVDWNSRQFARVSMQGYNSMADVSHLVDALSYLLPFVCR